MKLASHLRWRPIHWLVAAATLGAAALRFWHLGSLPPQAWYDEVWFALRAREMLQTGHFYAHYGIANTAGNAGLVYLTALAQLFGLKSIVCARVAAAVAGTLTIPLAYACFRELLRSEDRLAARCRITAALAATILSYLLFAVILSRVGMEPILLLPVMLFAIWQMARGARSGDWRSWAAAGLVVGLAQYNGPHPRLILPLAAYLIGEWLLGRNRQVARRTILRGTLAMGLAGLIVTLPLIVTFIHHPDWLVGRAAEVSLDDQQISPLTAIGANGLRVLGAWIVEGDTNPRHNLPGQPMLDPALAVGFLLGLGWALWHFRQSRMARLMMVWLIVMALPAVLTAEAPNMQRMIGTAPPTAALCVIGWTQIYDWLRRRSGAQLGRRWLTGGAILLVGSTAWNIYLFGQGWAHSPQLPEAFDAAVVGLGHEMVHRAETERVYAERLPAMFDVISFEYLFDNTTISRVDFSQCLPLPQQSETRTSYLLLADENGQTSGRLSAIYPGSHLTLQNTDIWTAGWSGQATLLEVPAGAAVPVPEKHPLAHFAPGFTLYGYQLNAASPLRPGMSFSMVIDWAIEGPIGTDWVPFIHIVPEGVYDQPPIAQHDGPPCASLYPTSQWHAGEIIMDWFDISLPPDLPAGSYELAAGWYDPATMTRAGADGADSPLADGRAIIGKIDVSVP